MAGIMFEKEATNISRAILDNDMASLKAALKKGDDPHHKDRKGNTYLHYVCTMYRPFIIHVILGTGIDVNAKNRHGNTALHVTALHHECCHVGDLLAAGIDPTIRNKFNKTAAEIPTRSKFWKSIYDKYEPGIFGAIASHDVDKVLYLLHCWARTDSDRNGQTLRQFAASLKFHDIVFHIDVHKCTLGAIHSVLQDDPEEACHNMSQSKCDINFLNYATECHILQHAIRLQNARLVDMICESRVNVNIRVTVQGFLKAPLFFAAIDPKVPERIMWAVLKAGADFTLRDERGRNAAIYSLDRTKGKISTDVIDHMLKHGLDVSQRDMTGVTIRDVARFARRRDIVTLIDKAYVKVIRESNMAELEYLAVVGYDSMLIDFNYRDTFIYASGNETDDALKLTENLPKFYQQVKEFHHSVCYKSVDDVTNILVTADRPDLLINAKDKGGRSALHLCILHWRFDVFKMLLSQPNIEVNTVDNLGRTVYHYTCALEDEDERKLFSQLLENAGINTETLDYSNHKASYNLNNTAASQLLTKERNTHYGMEKHLACVDKYEELCDLVKKTKKQLKQFEKAVSRFKYPASEFASILSPVMPEYRDLLFMAMDHDKEDIAVRLIQLGSDWRQKEYVCRKVAGPDGALADTRVLMSVAEYAEHLGMNKVIMAIVKKKEHLKRRMEQNKKPDNENVSISKEQKTMKIRMFKNSEATGEDDDEEIYYEEVLVDFDVDSNNCSGNRRNNDNEEYVSQVPQENDFSYPVEKTGGDIIM